MRVFVSYAGRAYPLTFALPVDVPEGRHLHVVQVLPVEPRAYEEIDLQRDAGGQLRTAVKAIYS